MQAGLRHALEMANATAHEPAPPMPPIHRGQGGEAKRRKNTRSLYELGSRRHVNVYGITGNCELPKFKLVDLELMKSEDPASILDVGDLDEPHSSEYVSSTAFIMPWSSSHPVCKTEDGTKIVWPWEERHIPGLVGGKAEAQHRPVRAYHRLDDDVNKYLDLASADGHRGRKHTGVKAWFSFCEDVMKTPGDRPLDPNAPLWVKLEEEWLAMRFVCALVEERGLQPQSASVYFSAVQGWHAREHGVKLAGGLKLERLPQMLKGMRRALGAEPRAVRRGIAPAMLKRAMDLLLDPAIPAHANVRAALATALQGLLRSQEFAVDSSSQRAAKMVPTRADLVELNDKRMVVMMAPCKNMHHLGGKTCPLVIGAGGEHVDAVWEVQNLLRVDPVPAHLAAETPLFRNPLSGKALTTDCIMQMTRQLMAVIGEDPMQFGTHSYRIGGATALFAAGANETVIRTMGRWSSDIHRLYVRACFEDCCEWTRRAGSAQVSDLAGSYDEVDFY